MKLSLSRALVAVSRWLYALPFLLAFACATPHEPAASPVEAIHHRPVNGVEEVVGQWQGVAELTPNIRLRVILEISATSAGQLTGALYSIDQTVTTQKTVDQSSDGKELAEISLNGAELHARSVDGKWAYEGRQHGERIDGVLSVNSNFGDYDSEGETVERKAQLNFVRATVATMWPLEPTPPKVSFVRVEQTARYGDVNLEVLDWDGGGRPLVLLAGGGANARAYYRFGPNLAALGYHVYAISRRGWGNSSAPDPDDGARYDPDQLGQDVLTAIEKLKLTQPPILVGHSRGGVELSWIGTRHPSAVAALIYLDALFFWSFDDGQPPKEKEWPPFLAGGTKAQRIKRAALTHRMKFTGIQPPILAIFGFLNLSRAAFSLTRDKDFAQDVAEDNEFVTEREARFRNAYPQAEVIRLEDSTHNLFMSNEAEVLRLVNDFIQRLPRSK